MPYLTGKVKTALKQKVAKLMKQRDSIDFISFIVTQGMKDNTETHYSICMLVMNITLNTMDFPIMKYSVSTRNWLHIFLHQRDGYMSSLYNILGAW